MDTTLAEMDQIYHFSHYHQLSLVHLQVPNHKNENTDDEDEDGDEYKADDFVEEEHHGGQCGLCKEQIWSFHLCYYYCKSCDYSLHKFCAELPYTEQTHPSHPGHKLSIHTLSNPFMCSVCNLKQENIYSYGCFECQLSIIDIKCATVSEHKIDHPSHPHRLERMSGTIASSCLACGNKHEGIFFHCTTCPTFRINLDCALLPAKLLIQNHTNLAFNHSHPLTLAYSFMPSENRANYYPRCRVCNGEFYPHLWIYKCDKCRYYVHVDCATSKREPFMSILLTESLGKTYKNYKEDEHPNLLHCPFHDEGENLLKRHMSSQKEITGKQHDGETLNHSCHEHPLVLLGKQTSVDTKMVSLHDPMKKTQLLCNGCVKPIVTVPFYMCCQYVDKQCCFVLHEWCTKLPLEIRDYVGHPNHTLFLLPKKGVFECAICELPSNGFAYGCRKCGFYIDTNCAFIPKEITHDAHPDHILSIVKGSINTPPCKACKHWTSNRCYGFHCPSCNFYIHVKCALLLPRVIKHKCDKHPLSLRYEPAENHIGEYFCEICEEQLNPWEWFYHCTTCAQSMHAACVPLILQYEQARYDSYLKRGVYKFLNVKFGGTLKFKAHSHRLAFVQGIKGDGDCFKCDRNLQHKMIFKCLECAFGLDQHCASFLSWSSS